MNASDRVIDVLDFANAAAPHKRFSIDPAGLTDDRGSVIPDGSVPNSVTVRKDGLGVIALENATKTDPGWLVFFDAERRRGLLGAVRVGALPDMVTISPDGKYAVVAHEGEPNEDYTVDPEGSVGIATLPRDVSAPRQGAVRIADFHEFEEDGRKKLDEDVRIFAGLGDSKNPVSANLEPEYVAVDRRSETAYVVLQEANATAVVDLRRGKVEEIWPLGFKDHGARGNGLEGVEGVEDPDEALDRAGDLGAEGVAFVASKDSPTKGPLVLVANEVSGTTTVFTVDLRRSRR